MKKILTLMMVSIFLIAMFPVSLAEEGTGDEEDMIDNISGVRVYDSRLRDVDEGNLFEEKIFEFIKAQKQSTVEDCTDDIIVQFPDFPKDRAEILCKRILEQPTPTMISVTDERLRSIAATRIQEMQVEQFRNEISARFQTAMEQCDQAEDPEMCEEALQKRIQATERISQMTIERIQQFEERKYDKIIEFRSNQDNDFAKYSEENMFRAREIAQERLQDAKERYLDAKERYQNAKERFNATKANFEDAKERLAECTDDDSESCNIMRDEMNDNAKEHLLRIADVIFERLDAIEGRIDSNEYLSDDEAADLKEKISEQKVKVTELKGIIEESESKEDIIAAAKDLRKIWAGMNKQLEIITGKLVHARVGQIIVQSEQLDIKLERIMQRMEEQGYDTAVLEPLVDEFSANINLAKEKYRLAVDKFKEASEMEEPDQALIDEAHQLMKDAHNALQDAQDTLRKIVLTIKQSGAQDMIEDASDDILDAVDTGAVELEGTEVIA